MKSKAEKQVAADPPSETPLPDDIAELLANARQPTAKELAGLVEAADALRADPEFLADCSRGLVLEVILRAMETANIEKKTSKRSKSSVKK